MKERLDNLLVQRGLVETRAKAKVMIMAGEVYVNGQREDKAGTMFNEKVDIEVKSKAKKYVSRGGFKLEKAMNTWPIDLKDKICMDIGSSTGGFTDCLLRHGAKKVYCVDVGENLLDEKISTDSRVVVMDRTNARYLTINQFDKAVDGIVVDCSFISLEYILPPLVPLLDDSGFLLALIKPQFELQERVKLKNGILRDDNARLKILKRIYDFSINCGLNPQGILNVAANKNKNVEYIIYLKKGVSAVTFESLIRDLK